MIYINWKRAVQIVERAAALKVAHTPGPYDKKRCEDSQIASITGSEMTVNTQLWNSTLRAMDKVEDREEALAVCLVYHYYVTLAKPLFRSEGDRTAFALGEVSNMLRRLSILRAAGEIDGPVR